MQALQKKEPVYRARLGTYVLHEELQLGYIRISEGTRLELLFVFQNDGRVGLGKPKPFPYNRVQDSICKGFVVPGHRALTGEVMVYRAVVLREPGQLVVN